jgi:hypothetical protein
MKYLVTFSGVGRAKRTWEDRLAQFPSEGVLERLVRNKKALASRGIECVFDDDEAMEFGTILVGGFRPVGMFRVQQDPS